MSKKMLTPDEICHAIALREAGYTTLAISQRLGISLRSLHRHFTATGTKKGAIKDELVQEAKAELLARITCDSTIREEAARLVADDIAHARHLRQLMLRATEHMKASTLTEVVQIMRAAAAYSTAIKNTSDIIRHSLRTEQVDTGTESLPTLVVQELTASEIDALREESKSESDLDDGCTVEA